MSLSAAQVLLYGKRWGAVCRANGWRMDRGRLQCSSRGAAEASQWHGRVWALAEQHAAQNSRGVTVEDMRKGAGAAVTGRYQSTKTYTNAQFDQLLTLFRLLIEPDDISATMDMDEPERARERQLDEFIGSAPKAYVATIARGMFHSHDWATLDVGDKQRLANTLRARQKNWGGKPIVAQVAEEVAAENIPF